MFRHRMDSIGARGQCFQVREVQALERTSTGSEAIVCVKATKSDSRLAKHDY